MSSGNAVKFSFAVSLLRVCGQMSLLKYLYPYSLRIGELNLLLKYNMYDVTVLRKEKAIWPFKNRVCSAGEKMEFGI